MNDQELDAYLDAQDEEWRRQHPWVPRIVAALGGLLIAAEVTATVIWWPW